MSMDIKINEIEAKELTQALIRIPSVNPPGDVSECANFIKSWLIKNNIPVKMVRSEHVDNVVAMLGDDLGRKILWNGHFDVVPAGDNWNTDPYEAVYKDGFIYGRGASDMKSGIAAMMLALKEIKKNNIQLKGQIVFTGVGDEETGSKNGTLMLLDKLGIQFESAVVSEPTDFYIESAQRGLRWIEIKILGKACHAGRPHVGNNAVEYAAKVIEALKNIQFDAQHDLFEWGLKEPSLSVTKISGGIQSNIIPEECTLLIDRRMMPGETEDKVIAQIREAIAPLFGKGFEITVEVVNKGWDPYVIDQDEEMLKDIIHSYKRITGEAPGVRGKGGCTDASHIFHAGIPVVILGPGSANESHTANEKVSVQRIARAAEIYADSAIQYLNR